MTDRKPPFASVEEALEDIRAGKMIVLVDDEDRENEGDLTMAAEKVTPEAINFMAKFGRGLICLAMTEQRCDALALAPITPRNTSMFGTPFCEPIDARRGTTTGTSAADRATTILAATSPDTHPEDLARPGHVYTLRARNGGVLVRAGQTEASVDLARLAGLDHSGVICEIMNDDGTMARIPQLVEFCKMHAMKLLTVADLIRYRMQHERHVRRIAESRAAHAAWKFPDDRVFERRGPRAARRAGARRVGRRFAKSRPCPWCACIRTALPATFSAPRPAIATRSSNARSQPSPRKTAACSFICITPGADSRLTRPAKRKMASCRAFVFTRVKKWSRT